MPNSTDNESMHGGYHQPHHQSSHHSNGHHSKQSLHNGRHNNSSSNSLSGQSTKAHQLSAQQLQHHHHITSATALPSSASDQIHQYSSSSAASSVSSVSLSAGSSSMMAIGTQTMHSDTLNSRRKSSLTSYAHVLHHSNSSASVAADCSTASNAKMSAYEPIPPPLSHHQSPSRFHVDTLGLHLGGGRLSIHSVSSSTDRFADDDRMSSACCLPPPSPAPNSDRYIIGLPAPSTSSGSNASAQQDLKFSVMHHRSMSPSSRYRSSMPDRYVNHHRDISPKCDRFGSLGSAQIGNTANSNSSSSSISSQSNYNHNSQSNAHSNSDSYAYLTAVAAASNAVHTPVKRYVPTPPPQGPVDYQQQQSAESQRSIGNSNVGHSSTLPYRYRMKCCPSDLANSAQTASDHYATPPRVRPVKYPSSTSSTLPSSSSGRISACEYSSVSGNSEQRASTPLAAASNESAAKTCLHCSTMRRTTGVHQTTQTNGPISPIPSTSNTIPPSASSSLGGSASQSSSTSSMAPVNTSSGSSSGVAGDCGGGSSTSSSPGPQPLSTTSSNVSCSSNSSGIGSTGQQQMPLSPVIGMTNEPKPLQAVSGKSNQHHKTITTQQPICQMQQQQQQTRQMQSQHQIQQRNGCSSTGISRPNNNLNMQQQQYMGSTSPQPTSSNVSSSSTTGISVLQQHQQHHQPQQHQNHHQQQQQQQLQHLAQQHQLQLHQQQQHQLMQSQQQMLPATPPPQPPPALPLAAAHLLHPATISSGSHMSRKQRAKDYIRRGTAKFFGVDCCSETAQRHKWAERQRRLAARRFGALRPDADFNGHMGGESSGAAQRRQREREQQGDRPDILPPAQTIMRGVIGGGGIGLNGQDDGLGGIGFELVERKASVANMLWQGMAAMVKLLGGNHPRVQRQWSRSFAPGHVFVHQSDNGGLGPVGSQNKDVFDAVPLHDDEVFFDSPALVSAPQGNQQQQQQQQQQVHQHQGGLGGRPLYMGERVHGWRTRTADQPHSMVSHSYNSDGGQVGTHNLRNSYRGTRINAQILDGVLDNSRRPLTATTPNIKLLRPNELDDRHDHRPFFTYWISTVQILVLCMSLVCYGLGPIGYGTEQKMGQVLVTTLSLQQVQHHEPRNVWIGPRGDDLVHLGAKFAACMRRDSAVWEAIGKTRRQERETACCIRNDDSGCVQSSQAECSVRGLWPTKSISTWKKWSPGESGPGGRISGSVCGLDPKFCDAPASVAPYEWPDDITKWPICRKTNSFSQRFRFKDHTAEHMVCEVIGHPCCTGVYGECRITTREFCDFVNGYFHEEASLCSQVSCLNDVCGMFPFLAFEQPDQFYRLFTSLCLHAGILHLALTVAFQQFILADLERLIGPIRTAILYIGSGVVGNLTSAIFEPYKPEVGPLAALSGVVGSLFSLLALIHWRQLRKPHITLAKLALMIAGLFGMGNMPWQQNVAGLIAGGVFGVALTVALVPFVSFTKYGRQSKINFIWSCLLFHAIVYVGLFVIFYIFPSTFAAMGWATGTESLATHIYSNGGYSVGGNVVSCDKGMCSGTGGGSSNGGGSVLHHSGGGGRMNA